ncbi:hypothetical protein SNK05_004363 [Fusarium graminearum]
MTYLLPPRLLPSLNIFPSTPNLPPFTTHNTQHMAKDLVVPRYTRLRPLRILAATTPNSSFHFNHHPARTHERRPDPKNEGPNPRAKTRPKNEDPTQEPRPPAPVDQPLDLICSPTPHPTCLPAYSLFLLVWAWSPSAPFDVLMMDA